MADIPGVIPVKPVWPTRRDEDRERKREQEQDDSAGEQGKRPGHDERGRDPQRDQDGHIDVYV